MSHPLSTRAARVVWFNSILEALTLSDDHLGYVQQLILTSVSDNSPFLTSPSSNTATPSPIPELIVLLAKCDYVSVYLHEAMNPILTVINEKLQKLIKIVKNDHSQALQLNIINIFAETLSQWLHSDVDTNISNKNVDSISPEEQNQALLIILAIASINLFTQVNYSGLPLVLPVTLQQYRDNSDKIIAIKPNIDPMDQIDEGDEDNIVNDIDTTVITTTTTVVSTDSVIINTKNQISVQTRVNLFFSLFSPKYVHNTAGVLELMDRTQGASNNSSKKWISVEKTILCNGALKLNGEDAYQCAHYPLFLIITRAILGCEGLLTNIMGQHIPIVKDFNNLTSVLVREANLFFSDEKNEEKNDEKNNIKKMTNYFSCPALLTYALRSVKLHTEVLLSPTATIRTEFYTLSLIYQLLYGILSSGYEQTQSPQNSYETICSEFKCMKFKPFHFVYDPWAQQNNNNNNNNDINKNENNNTNVRLVNQFVSLYTILNQFKSLLPSISFIDTLSGHDYTSITYQSDSKSTPSTSSTMTNTTSTVVSPITTSSNTNNSQYDAVLLIAYNYFAQSNPTNIDTTTKSTTTKDTVNSALESNVDDIHAVGISPLTHAHTHASYRPITLFPTSQTQSTNTITSIPITLATTLFTTITIELAQIALKLYLYKRSFLLLSLSKVFSGLSIYVSGILGRRTRYQSRSFAQLHGISFLHNDIIKAIEYDSRLSHDITQNYTQLTFTQINTTTLPSTTPVPIQYIISTDITDSSVAQYIIPTDDAAALIPALVQETNEKFLQEKEKYKGVINERNPTIPRVSKLSHSDYVDTMIDNDDDDIDQENKQTFALCVSRGGHVEDVPIDSVDDIYLTYMLPDQDNYNVEDGKNLKDGKAIANFNPLSQGLIRSDGDNDTNTSTGDDDEDEKVVVKAGGTLEGVVDLLATSKGGVIFEANMDDVNSDYSAQATLRQIEPPLDSFQPYMQSSIGSVLALAVANYLYQTCPQNEITQQEQDCYLQTIFMHRFNQGNKYFDQDKNKHGNNYDHYSSLFDFNSYSIPYQTIFGALMMRSVLEYTNTRLQTRAISQIELLTNLFVASDDKLSHIHFRPQYLPEVIDLYHNIGIDSTTYHLDIRQVTKSNSPLGYLYNGISLPHHQFQREAPDVYNSIVDKTMRNLLRFRQNKVFTSSTVPWWETLRVCADICTKTGFISTSLRCYVNVQLWSSVIDTLIKIGRRGDATKLLRHVLKVPNKGDSAKLLADYKENRRLELEFKEKQQKALELAQEANQLAIAIDINSESDVDIGSGSDNDDMKDEFTYTPPSSPLSGPLSTPFNVMTPITFSKTDLDLDIDSISPNSTKTSSSIVPEADNNDDEDENANDSDYREGSLLYFVAKAMESTLFTTTTSSGLQTLSASNYRLYHLLGESTQDHNYWELSWELSNYTYAPPQRAFGKWLAVRKRNNEAYIAYQNALHLNGSDHQTWYECGVVATRLGWYEKAIPCFSNALRLKPDISEGWNNLAACHLYLENTSSAYHALSQCLRGRSSSWKIWENFLQCSLQLGYYNDVLSSLNQISQLKGKIDPMTLLPIQYTTSQSKFHVFALYSTWYQHLQSQVQRQVHGYVNNAVDDSIGPVLPSDLQDIKKSKHDHDDCNDVDCILCVKIPFDPVLAQFQANTQTNNWVQFPIVKNFSDAIHSVMTNISHNESREAEMGGMIRGGGDDAGAGNSVAASIDFAAAMRDNNNNNNNRPQQFDDDNAESLLNDSDDDNNVDSDELLAQGKLLQLLSLTAKGQKCILYHLLGLSTQSIAIQGDISLIKTSSVDFENCINILIKILIENAYGANFTPHIDFIITNTKHIINNATLTDYHILKHQRDYTVKPITNDDRTIANHKELTVLLLDRLLDGFKRDYNNNKANLGHLLPYIDQINTFLSDLKAACKDDDEFFKAQLQGGSGQTAIAEDVYEYDPYGSFY